MVQLTDRRHESELNSCKRTLQFISDSCAEHTWVKVGSLADRYKEVESRCVEFDNQSREVLGKIEQLIGSWQEFDHEVEGVENLISKARQLFSKDRADSNGLVMQKVCFRLKLIYSKTFF